MKTIVPVLLFTIITFLANATTRTVVSNSGQGWNNASNWSPSGVPQSGDTVIIPFGQTIGVKTNVYNNTPNLVIRIYGTLNFASGGKLDLGSTSTLIVYANGFITGTNSPSERIKIGGVDKYAGNIDGTIVGPASASLATGTSPSGFGQGLLPVKFQSFSVKSKGNAVVSINWTVTEESDINNYTIEKSTDGRNWNEINKQAARNIQQVITYTGTDNNATASVNYYRVKAVGVNGELFFSHIESVTLKQQSTFSVYPNPATTFVKVNVTDNNLKAPFNIHLYPVNGSTVFGIQYNSIQSLPVINVNGLPKGMYIIELTDANGIKQQQKVMIN